MVNTSEKITWRVSSMAGVRSQTYSASSPGWNGPFIDYLCRTTGHVDRDLVSDLLNGVPMFGVAGEIALGRCGPVGPDGIEAHGIGNGPMVFAPRVDQREKRHRDRARCRRQKHPAALSPPHGYAGIDKDLDVARYTRLALPQHLCQFTDRQLHPPQQRDDP